MYKTVQAFLDENGNAIVALCNYDDDLDKRQIIRELQFIQAEQDAEIEKMRQVLKTGKKPQEGN